MVDAAVPAIRSARSSLRRPFERTSPTISSVIAWSVVQEIYETQTLLLLYLAPNQAIIVPALLPRR